MVSKSEIMEKQKELAALKKEYMEERPPCMNKECGWFRETGQTNNCSWTVFHDECGEYKNEIMKSYTDLPQSKKLAEILPLESADMVYIALMGNTTYPDVLKVNLTNKHWNEMYPDVYIPCWSLAALLSVLPRVDIEKEICSDGTYDYRVKAYIGDGYIGDWYDNPINACVNMIVKLHKLNLL